MRALTPRGRGAVAALGVLAAVIVTALVAVAQRPADPHWPQPEQNITLCRCRDLGLAAQSDAGCREAWRRLSQHFFGPEAQAREP